MTFSPPDPAFDTPFLPPLEQLTQAVSKHNDALAQMNTHIMIIAQRLDILTQLLAQAGHISLDSLREWLESE